MTTTTIGAGSDTLALGITEDFYQDYAQFSVSLDGQQVGGILTASSPHEGPSSDTLNVLANLAPGIHTVTVNFLNDAYGGTIDTDRNLYLDGATYDGTFVPSVAQELQVSGPVTFGVFDSTPVPTSSTTTTIGSGSDTLVLSVSQDAYGDNAQFTVSLDGQQVGDVLTVSSLHGSGTSDTVNVFADLSAGPHTVTVNFLNDAYNGTPDTDRNLYVDSATYDGAAVSGAAQVLYSSGPASFGVTDIASTPAGPLVVAADTTVTAEGAQLAGVTVDLEGSFGAPANLTLDDATVGSLTVVDTDLSNGSSARYGHLDVYGQSAITGNTTIGGSRPLAPGFVDAYVHGSDGVFTLHGVSLGGASTLTINSDEGAVVENDGSIRIGGGAGGTGTVNIQTDLQGVGTISGAQDVAGDPARVLLGGVVGAGQTINLTQTNLELNRPMSFAGTLTGFNSNGAPGVNRSGLTLDHESVTGTSFAQSSNGLGDLSVFTQDQETGAAGATLDFHVAGTFASDAFAFTNNTTAQSATIFLASSGTT